jgi:methylated-DNA-[protein]-cysteine S-methyltransferase
MTTSGIKASSARDSTVKACGLTVFDTAIGPCGLAWMGDVIVATALPEGDAAGTRQRLMRRVPEAVETAPPPAIAEARDRIVALLEGGRDDLGDITLDMAAVPDFNRKVYAIARAIPPGETRTYGEIARRVGGLEQSRAVGMALGQNPFPIVVPCHRVLGANGKAGGFSADGGVETKLRMLSIERAQTGSEPSLFEALPLAMAPKRR